jgi:hypothetical protein
MKRRTWQLVAVPVIAIVGVLGIRIAEGQGTRLFDSLTTADAASGSTKMWIDTPEVAPGGAVHVRVLTGGGDQWRIASVRASAGSGEVELRRASSGSAEYTHSRFDDDKDEVELDVPVPHDARPDATLSVHAAVDVHAVDDPTGIYVVGSLHQDDLDAPFEIATTGAVLLWRAWHFAWAIASLVLLVGVGWIGGKRQAGGHEREAAALGFALVIVVSMFGDVAFARPLILATGLFTDWVRVPLELVVFALPVLAFFGGRRRTSRTVPQMRSRGRD